MSSEEEGEAGWSTQGLLVFSQRVCVCVSFTTRV